MNKLYDDFEIKYKMYILRAFSCESDDLTDISPMTFTEFVESYCNKKEDEVKSLLGDRNDIR